MLAQSYFEGTRHLRAEKGLCQLTADTITTVDMQGDSISIERGERASLKLLGNDVAIIFTFKAQCITRGMLIDYACVSSSIVTHHVLRV